MDNSTRVFLWLVILIIVGIGSFFGAKTTRTYIVTVSPHTTYQWYADQSSVLQGDGQTHLYFKSDLGNFTVYDQDGLFVTTGQPLPMLPGDTKQIFTADFVLQSGYQYFLSDNEANLYTLKPSELHFTTQRYWFYIVLYICVILFCVTIFIVL